MAWHAANWQPPPAPASPLHGHGTRRAEPHALQEMRAASKVRALLPPLSPLFVCAASLQTAVAIAGVCATPTMRPGRSRAGGGRGDRGGSTIDRRSGGGRSQSRAVSRSGRRGGAAAGSDAGPAAVEQTAGTTQGRSSHGGGGGCASASSGNSRRVGSGTVDAEGCGRGGELDRGAGGGRIAAPGPCGNQGRTQLWELRRRAEPPLLTGGVLRHGGQ